MEIIFLGTGTSLGVPLLLHDNKHMDLTNPKNFRTRSSVHVVMDGYHVQIDAGPEFRLQCMHNSVKWIDTFILTHEHSDHVMGMDDLRRFCELSEGGVLPMYTTKNGTETVQRIFPYTLLGKPVRQGYPSFNMKIMPTELEVPGGWIRSTLLPHPPIETLGLVFEERSSRKKIAYYSDCKTIPEEAFQLAKGADIFIVDGLRPMGDNPSHMTISEAVAAAQKVNAPRSYLTHIGVEVDHDTISKTLPKDIELAYDGLKIVL